MTDRVGAAPATRAALAALALLAAAATGSAASAPPSPLDALRFLHGTWRGDGSGTPGQGSGTATFAPDLDGRVLVRRSHSEYPAAGGRPAAVHDDLRVIHPAPGGRALQAVSFDNEGHVIEYDDVAVSPDGTRVVFTSEAEAGSPRFRLTYSRAGADAVDVTFEVAPPGAPDAFKPYVSGRTRRVRAE